MQASNTFKFGAMGLSFLVLSSCTDSAGKPPVSFQSQYAEARDALEQGDFARANRMYLKLAPGAGALQPRLLLELSHGYLRAGEFSAAAAEAGALAESQTGAGRSAALAVEATARHELALNALAGGDTKEGLAQLEQALDALLEVLDRNPEFDPLGALAGRREAIAERLVESR